MGETEEPNWEQKSIDEFNLLPVPANWMEGDMPNWVWKSYYKERTAIKETEAETVAFGERSWNDDGEGHMCDLWKKCRRELQTIEEDIRGSGAELGFPSWSMNTNMAVVHLVSDDGESVRTAEYIIHCARLVAVCHSKGLETAASLPLSPTQ